MSFITHLRKRLSNRSLIIFVIFSLIGAVLPASSAAQFSTAKFGNILLTANESDWKFGEEAVGIIQEYLPVLSRSLGKQRSVYVHVIVAHTENEFQQMTGGNIPEWGIAAAEVHSGVIFLKSPRIYRTDNDFRTIVIHELSHVVLGNAVAGKPVPRWFDEGFALYNSGELGISSTILMSRSLLTGQALSLDEIDDVLRFRRDKAMLAYRESLSAIEYLTEHYGSEVIARLAAALSEGKTMEESIMNVTGSSMRLFEEAWMESIRNKYLWFAVLDMRSIFGLLLICLLFIAWARKRRQVKQLNENWEKEENYERVT